MVNGRGLRSARERLVQTLAFEGLGLLVVAPLYACFAGAGGAASFALIAALSLVVTVWSAAYNTLFDWVEQRRTGRAASDRPHGLRTLHAIGLEASAVVVSCPVIWAMTELGWWGALVADLGLTVAYAVYGYLFHLGFDRLRPVRNRAQAASSCLSTNGRIPPCL